MTDLALFDMPAVPDTGLTRGQRRLLRQQVALQHGQHPVGLCFSIPLRLHRDAPSPDERRAPGPRCGTCVFRGRWGEHGFPKCLRGESQPFASHSEASDCKAWWPGCEHWEARQR